MVTTLLSIAEASRKINLSTCTLRRYVRDGKVSHVRFGRRVLLLDSDLDALVARHRKAAL